MKMHSFSESLKKSHESEDYPFWEEIYKKAFNGFASMTSHRKNGEWQRLGIDRTILLESGKSFLIDEKIRFTEYNDILLEIYSDVDRAVLGWVQKPLYADYIAYAFAVSGRCYFLPVPQLQESWRKNGHAWEKDFFCPLAKNFQNGSTWTTKSCAVPVNTLFKAIGECLRVQFTPFQGVL